MGNGEDGDRAADGDAAERDGRRRSKVQQRAGAKAGAVVLGGSAAALNAIPPGSALLPAWWDDDATVAQFTARPLPACPPGTAKGTTWNDVHTAWASIARTDIPSAARLATMRRAANRGWARRTIEACAGVVRGRCTRSFRLQQSGALRLKRLARDGLGLWRRLEREVQDTRRRAEREQADAERQAEELREAKRQQQRLNFLLTQTELYAHFMASKQQAQTQTQTQQHGGEDEEARQLESVAREKAASAANAAKAAAAAFDSSIGVVATEGDQAGAGPSDGAAAMAGVEGEDVVECPSTFQAQLKGYQLTGLRWLVNAYDSGINCILADEMGLGKTVQALAFLSYLAEKRNMWGPFIVVTPSSTLPNWADEVRRFCPNLRLCPYWGQAADRAVLRRSLSDASSKTLGTADAPWHVLVTSYQLLVLDEKHLRRTKWRFMVCDEAQALKSAASGRWKTLLGFTCRNRLLLTGTPVQNTMAELWALLHFIMPQLFDSHDQFADWFSKGVEGAVQDGQALNAHQLARLHAVLKPFMLRRVKKDVESEMAPKTEYLVRCALSPRQQSLYAAVKARISIADLLQAAGAGGLSERKTLHLMNVVIQLRKVCNHPELFEARPPRASLRMAAPPRVAPPPPTGATAAALATLVGGPGGSNPGLMLMMGDAAAAVAGSAGTAETVYAPECGGGHGWSSSLVSWHLPKLLWRNGLHCVAGAGAPFSGGPPADTWANMYSESGRLCIWRTSNVAAAAWTDRDWAWARLIGMSPSQLVASARAHRDPLFAWALHRMWASADGDGMCGCLPHELFSDSRRTDPGDASATRRPYAPPLCIRMPPRVSPHWQLECGADGLDGALPPPLLVPIATRYLAAAPLLRSVQCYMPPATAPPVRVVCSDRSFAMQQATMSTDPALWLLFTADQPLSSAVAPPPPAAVPPFLRRLAQNAWPLRPLWASLCDAFGTSDPGFSVEDYSLAAALADSGKMQALDGLLRERFAGGHKCLVFSQMTKMMDLLEAYCRFRKWAYLRLDGSTSVADRRDMVRAWQSPGDTHFVFLLSTRAGGLGINLTAADTVIFYDNDWNPTQDAQAMDRAHRLGQTKPVSVYRLVCGATVEERILMRAQQKQTVQALVMAEDTATAAAALATAASGGAAQIDEDGGGAPGVAAGGDVFAPEEVFSLLLDDDELAAQLAANQQQRARTSGPHGSSKRRQVIRMADDGETVAGVVDMDDAGAAPNGADGNAAAAGAVQKPAAKKRAPARRLAGAQATQMQGRATPAVQEAALATPAMHAATHTLAAPVQSGLPSASVPPAPPYQPAALAPAIPPPTAAPIVVPSQATAAPLPSSETQPTQLMKMSFKIKLKPQ